MHYQKAICTQESKEYGGQALIGCRGAGRGSLLRSLCVDLVADLHVVRVVHYVLYHVLEHRVARHYWVDLRAVVLLLRVVRVLLVDDSVVIRNYYCWAVGVDGYDNWDLPRACAGGDVWVYIVIMLFRFYFQGLIVCGMCSVQYKGLQLILVDWFAMSYLYGDISVTLKKEIYFTSLE